MSKYFRLAAILSSKRHKEWRVSFAELERLLGGSLPASAYKYPAWWSNNPTNNSMTTIWLNAGWRTEQVDVPGQTVVFCRVDLGEKMTIDQGDDKYADYPDILPAGMTEETRMFNNKVKPSGKDIFSKLYGCMKGTVRIAPGVDLAVSTYSGNDKKAFDAKWDRLLPQPPHKQASET
jgi:hypothetical protein